MQEIEDDDVFFLSESGIRSLRARDSSNAAFASDIGNPIDTLILSEITPTGWRLWRRVPCWSRVTAAMLAVGEDLRVLLPGDQGVRPGRHATGFPP